jgi:hypothetical protein
MFLILILYMLKKKSYERVGKQMAKMENACDIIIYFFIERRHEGMYG